MTLELPYALIQWPNGLSTVVEIASGGAIAPDSLEYEKYVDWHTNGGEPPILPNDEGYNDTPPAEEIGDTE